jgi:hypothetical protein
MLGLEDEAETRVGQVRNMASNDPSDPTRKQPLKHNRMACTIELDAQTHAYACLPLSVQHILLIIKVSAQPRVRRKTETRVRN